MKKIKKISKKINKKIAIGSTLGVAAVGAITLTALQLSGNLVQEHKTKTYGLDSLKQSGLKNVEVAIPTEANDSGGFVWTGEKNVIFNDLSATQMGLDAKTLKLDYNKYEYRMDHSDIVSDSKGKGSGDLKVKAYKKGEAPTNYNYPLNEESEFSSDEPEQLEEIQPLFIKTVKIVVEFIKQDRVKQMISDQLSGKEFRTVIGQIKEFKNVPIAIPTSGTSVPKEMTPQVGVVLGLTIPQGTENPPIYTITIDKDDVTKAEIKITYGKIEATVPIISGIHKVLPTVTKPLQTGATKTSKADKLTELKNLKVPTGFPTAYPNSSSNFIDAKADFDKAVIKLNALKAKDNLDTVEQTLAEAKVAITNAEQAIKAAQVAQLVTDDKIKTLGQPEILETLKYLPTQAYTDAKKEYDAALLLFNNAVNNHDLINTRKALVQANVAKDKTSKIQFLIELKNLKVPTGFPVAYPVPSSGFNEAKSDFNDAMNSFNSVISNEDLNTIEQSLQTAKTAIVAIEDAIKAAQAAQQATDDSIKALGQPGIPGNPIGVPTQAYTDAKKEYDAALDAFNQAVKNHDVVEAKRLLLLANKAKDKTNKNLSKDPKVVFAALGEVDELPKNIPTTLNPKIQTLIDQYNVLKKSFDDLKLAANMDDLDKTQKALEDSNAKDVEIKNMINIQISIDKLKTSKILPVAFKNSSDKYNDAKQEYDDAKVAFDKAVSDLDFDESKVQLKLMDTAVEKAIEAQEETVNAIKLISTAPDFPDVKIPGNERDEYIAAKIDYLATKTKFDQAILDNDLDGLTSALDELKISIAKANANLNPKTMEVKTYEYDGIEYDTKAEALAKAQADEEAKLKDKTLYNFDGKTYDDRTKAETALKSKSSKDITDGKWTSGAAPSDGLVAPAASTENTVYVYQGNAYETEAQAITAWLADNPGEQEIEGTFDVMYGSTKVKTFSISNADKDKYKDASLAQTELAKKFNWVKDTPTSGTAGSSEVLPNSVTTEQKDSIKVDGKEYTYRNVGSETPASTIKGTPAKEYTKDELIEWAQKQLDGKTGDTFDFNVDGEAVQFKKAIAPPTTDTFGKVLEEHRLSVFTFEKDDKTYLSLKHIADPKNILSPEINDLIFNALETSKKYFSGEYVSTDYIMQEAMTFRMGEYLCLTPFGSESFIAAFQEMEKNGYTADELQKDIQAVFDQKPDPHPENNYYQLFKSVLWKMVDEGATYDKSFKPDMSKIDHVIAILKSLHDKAAVIWSPANGVDFKELGMKSTNNYAADDIFPYLFLDGFFLSTDEINELPLIIPTWETAKSQRSHDFKYTYIDKGVVIHKTIPDNFYVEELPTFGDKGQEFIFDITNQDITKIKYQDGKLIFDDSSTPAKSLSADEVKSIMSHQVWKVNGELIVDPKKVPGYIPPTITKVSDDTPVTGTFYHSTIDPLVFTTTSDDKSEGFVADTKIDPYPDQAGWYSGTGKSLTSFKLPTLYLAKDKTISDKEYVTDPKLAQGYKPSVTESRIDHYKLQFDGVDVAGHTQDVPWVSASAPSAPILDNTQITIDGFKGYTSASPQNADDAKASKEINSMIISSGFANVHSAGDAGVDVKTVVEATGGYIGFIYDGKYYSTKELAQDAYSLKHNDEITETKVKSIYQDVDYKTNEAAIVAILAELPSLITDDVKTVPYKTDEPKTTKIDHTLTADDIYI